jgi:pyruvate/2-oxoglutarate dehydrogenase complex dihydrolipoamide acyltransferase (E2) component
MSTATRAPLALCLLLAGMALGGCTNPDAASSPPFSHQTASPQNAGEPPAPAPPSPRTQAPAEAQSTPTLALTVFARLYTNWTYRTLSTNQRTLAAMSVGAARLAERQATASSQGDTTIARGRIYNHGQIVSIARDLTHTDSWVIVTREQTGGDTQYEGLAAAYHVTIAKLASIDNGYAVEQWLPQN